MRSVIFDKVASVTANCRVSREAKLGDEFPCQEGDVVAVRVLTRKTSYNTLELTTGRFSLLNPGDVLAGALGHRRALQGYAGRLPEKLAVGDKIDILNLGGVLGICEATHPDLGQPFSCEVLGQVLAFPYLGERIGVPANIRQGARAIAPRLDCRGVPVVAVVGTCMNAGKTAACAALIQEFGRLNLNVAAAKSTGVSLRRDVLNMEDAGARPTFTFTDLGIVTTTAACAPAAARTLLSALAESHPDVIVLELGDGLLGPYGVAAILADEEIRKSFTAVVLAASDPVGAWGGVLRLREEYGIATTVVTGPATDNTAGTEIIEEMLKTPAHNARTSPQDLARVVLAAIGRARELTPAGPMRRGMEDHGPDEP